MNTDSQPQKELTSFGYGFLGIVIFSVTLPATRIAISGGLDPVFVVWIVGLLPQGYH